MSSKIHLGPNESITLGDNAALSDVEIVGDTGQATIAELADEARRHYAAISIEALSWYSLIPDAIDSWEREQMRLRRPSLLARLRRLFRQLWAGSAVVVCPECYLNGGWEPGACEGCRAREGCRETVLLL